MVTGVVEAQELVASDRYLRQLSAGKKRLAAKLEDWQARADQAAAGHRRGAAACATARELEERKLRGVAGGSRSRAGESGVGAVSGQVEAIARVRMGLHGRYVMIVFTAEKGP